MSGKGWPKGLKRNSYKELNRQLIKFCEELIFKYNTDDSDSKEFLLRKLYMMKGEIIRYP